MDTVYYWLYYKRQTNTFLCPFSGFQTAVKFLLSILNFQMRVGVQSNADIRMPHDILQRFRVHPLFAMLEQKVCRHTWGVIFGS